MKRLIAIFLAASIMFSLVACGKEKADKYCTNCGNGMAKNDSFCAECGAAVGGSVSTSSTADFTESATTTTTSQTTKITTVQSVESTNTTTKKSTNTTTKKNTTTTIRTTTAVPKDIPIEAILLDNVSVSLMPGDTTLLGATIYPYNATNQTLYWESSDSSIATVDNTGTITALSYGNVTISVHSANGTCSTECLVMVKNDPILTCRDFPLHLYSNDGKEYLGKLVTNPYDSDSIWNEYGTYGSKYQTNSIWNEYGKYGSKYQTTSAFNDYATKPPIIVTNSGKTIGYLTSNEYKLNGYTIIQLERALKKVGQ